MCICKCIRICICMYVYTHIYIYAWNCICTCICICISTCIITYIYMYISAYGYFVPDFLSPLELSCRIRVSCRKLHFASALAVHWLWVSSPHLPKPAHAQEATVNITRSRTVSRMDTRLYMRITMWPLGKSLYRICCRIHVLWLSRNGDRSSCGPVQEHRPTENCLRISPT